MITMSPPAVSTAVRWLSRWLLLQMLMDKTFKMFNFNLWLICSVLMLVFRSLRSLRTCELVMHSKAIPVSSFRWTFFCCEGRWGVTSKTPPSRLVARNVLALAFISCCVSQRCGVFLPCLVHPSTSLHAIICSQILFPCTSFMILFVCLFFSKTACFCMHVVAARVTGHNRPDNVRMLDGKSSTIDVDNSTCAVCTMSHSWDGLQWIPKVYTCHTHFMRMLSS